MQKILYKFYTLLTLLFLSSIATAQSDITSDNKIGVVGGVIVIIFVIVLLYLLRLEKKISNLENKMKGEKK